jgi:hypothetical protein
LGENAVEARVPRGLSRAIGLACHALDLEGGEEAFHRRVVPDIARSAQAARHPVLGHQPLERLALRAHLGLADGAGGLPSMMMPKFTSIR